MKSLTGNLLWNSRLSVCNIVSIIIAIEKCFGNLQIFFVKMFLLMLPMITRRVDLSQKISIDNWSRYERSGHSYPV